MPTLHLINHPEALHAALQVAAEADTILLLGEAVCLIQAPLPRQVFVLQEELPEPGEMDADSPSRPDERFSSIDYPGFVELVVTHKPVVTWR